VHGRRGTLSFLQRLAPAKPGVQVVPVRDSRLVDPPTQVDFAAVAEARKVDDTHIEILDLDPELVNDPYLLADRAGQLGDPLLDAFQLGTMAVQKSEWCQPTEFAEQLIEFAFFRLKCDEQAAQAWDECACLFDREVTAFLPLHRSTAASRDRFARRWTAADACCRSYWAIVRAGLAFSARCRPKSRRPAGGSLPSRGRGTLEGAMREQAIADQRAARQHTIGGHLLLATTAVLWGSSYIGTRAIVGDVPPLLLGFLRALSATLVLGVLAKLAGESLRARLSAWIPLAGLGVLGVAYFYIGLNLALQWTTATAASFLSLPYPALTAVGGWLFLRERLGTRQIAGIGLAALGATWLTVASAQDNVGGAWIGNLLALSIMVAWTAYTLLGRRLLLNWTPLAATFHMMAAGTLVLALAAGLEYFSGGRPSWTVESTLITLYLGVVCTGLGYAFWNAGLRRVRAATASVYLYLQPVTVVVLGIALLGEQPSLVTLVAGALVIAGTALTAGGERAR
jgi:drug/metabolite transporter (DMT)-like permease